MYYSQNMNFNAEQSHSAPLFPLSEILPISLMSWPLYQHPVKVIYLVARSVFSEPKLCANRCAYMISIQPCMIGLPIKYLQMPDCTPAVWATSTSDAWWQLFQHHDLCTSNVASPICQEGQSERNFPIFAFSSRFLLFLPDFSWFFPDF